MPRPSPSFWGNFEGNYYPENWNVYDQNIQRQIHQQDWVDYLREMNDVLDYGQHSPLAQPWSQERADDFLSQYAEWAGLEYNPAGQAPLPNWYTGDPGTEHYFASRFGPDANREDYRRWLEFLQNEGLAELDPAALRRGSPIPYKLTDRGALDFMGIYNDPSGVQYNINNFAPENQSGARALYDSEMALRERQEQWDRNRAAGIMGKGGRPVAPSIAGFGGMRR